MVKNERFHNFSKFVFKRLHFLIQVTQGKENDLALLFQKVIT